MKLRPSGISKYGRFYPAFWACPEMTKGKWCKETRNAAEEAVKQQLGLEVEEVTTTCVECNEVVDNPKEHVKQVHPVQFKEYKNAVGEKLPWED